MSPGRLSDVARHVVAPAGIVATGWPAVRDTCAELDIGFDEWQDGAGRLILSKRSDGSYACGIGGVVLSIPRQVGKTFLIAAIVFALCLLNPGLTVLWTAHRLRTSNETFGKLQALTQRKKIAPHIRNVRLTNGEQEIRFHNGSRIMFGAREHGFGRGFDDVDVEVFDEAQILTENAIDDMVPATNTAPNPLLIYAGTPPRPTDPSEVFSVKRTAALSGADIDTAYIEFSADADANPLDRDQWRKANPSYPHRTSEAAMLRMLSNLTPESVKREMLGIWDPLDDGHPINLSLWSTLADGDFDPETLSDVRLALDAPPSLRSATFAVAGVRPDERRHVQGRLRLNDIERDDPRPLRLRVIEAAKALSGGHGTPVLMPPGSDAGAWIADLTAAGVETEVVSAIEFARACGDLVSAVNDQTVTHFDQEYLNTAVEGVAVRRSGGRDVWDPRRSKVDISGLQAATVALGRVPVADGLREMGSPVTDLGDWLSDDDDWED